MNEQTQIEALAPGRVPLGELDDGQRVDGVYAVRDRELRRKRDGEAWLKLTLGDSSGSVEAVAWEEAEARFAVAAPGTPVFVSGGFEVSERWGSKIKLSAPAAGRPHEYRPEDLAAESDGLARSCCESDLRQLLETIQNPQLRELLDRFFGEDCEHWAASATRRRQRSTTRPTATGFSSTRSPSPRRCPRPPHSSRESTETSRSRGALLHDIGKTEAYNDDPLAIDLTDSGRLQGEIPLGYYKVRRRIEEIPGFDPGLAQAVLHIILSHHGSLEHGSPVVPATREAVLVHMIDNLGGRLGSFDRLERQLPAGESWSGFDRALSGSAYFGLARRAA